MADTLIYFVRIKFNYTSLLGIYDYLIAHTLLLPPPLLQFQSLQLTRLDSELRVGPFRMSLAIVLSLSDVKAVSSMASKHDIAVIANILGIIVDTLRRKSALIIDELSKTANTYPHLAQLLAKPLHVLIVVAHFIELGVASSVRNPLWWVAGRQQGT